jgi:hypothetical protein
MGFQGRRATNCEGLSPFFRSARLFQKHWVD